MTETAESSLNASAPGDAIAPARFVRDRPTWFGYIAFAYAFFIISGLGPAMPFIRERLHLSYTVAGFHFTASSLGMVAGGLIGDRVSRRLGRQRTVWITLATITAGPVLLMVSPTMFITLPGMLLSGFSSMTMAIAIQSDITERHGRFRAKPLVEVNLAASSGAIAASLLVGAFSRTGIGWAGAYLLLFVAGGLAATTMRTVQILPGKPIGRGTARVRLTRRFWVLASINALSAAVEWCVGFWGTDFLRESTGVRTSTAALLMGAFFLAMVVGRLIGSRINHSISSLTLLAVSFSLALVGFTTFWGSGHVVPTVAGLVIFGLGTANIYPASATYATELVPTRPDLAFARLMLVSSTAILIAPQALGILGDTVGIEKGFMIGIPLTMLAVTLAIGLRQTERQRQDASFS